MHARMNHPAFVVPDAMPALQALGNAIQHSGISPKTLELVNLRASQINGCGVCAVQHPRIARKLGETDERLFAVAAWREAPFFTEAERAALALTEAATRMSDRADPVPDEIWNEAARHYDQQALAALVLAIANINVWNRLNHQTGCRSRMVSSNERGSKGLRYYRARTPLGGTTSYAITRLMLLLNAAHLTAR